LFSNSFPRSTISASYSKKRSLLVEHEGRKILATFGALSPFRSAYLLIHSSASMDSHTLHHHPNDLVRYIVLIILQTLEIIKIKVSQNQYHK